MTKTEAADRAGRWGARALAHIADLRRTRNLYQKRAAELAAYECAVMAAHCARLAPADEPGVWVVIVEWSAGGGDPDIRGVFSTKAAADTAQLTAIDGLRLDGQRVWFDPRNPDAPEDESWDADVHVIDCGAENDLARKAAALDKVAALLWRDGDWLEDVSGPDFVSDVSGIVAEFTSQP